MFKPIIHNLTRKDKGFKEIQFYNMVIACKRNRLQGQTLHEKIIAERNWKESCKDALKDVKNILGDSIYA